MIERKRKLPPRVGLLVLLPYPSWCQNKEILWKIPPAIMDLVKTILFASGVNMLEP